MSRRSILRIVPTVRAYRLASMDTREGTHTGFCTMAQSKVTPPAARRSTLGVRAQAFP